MVTYNFGDAFVQSAQFGAKLAQEEDKMKAEQVLEGLKMDALNKQISIAEQTRLDQSQHQYRSDLNEAITKAHMAYTQIDLNDRDFQDAVKISGEQVASEFNIKGYTDPKSVWVPTQYYGIVKTAKAQEGILNRQSALANAKESKDDEFISRMMELTKLANENARGLTKQETTPGQEPGFLYKYFADEWRQSSMKNIIDKVSKWGNPLSSGSKPQTQRVIDESKLSPAMDRQAQLLQNMEVEMMNKKVNPKLASTFLDPQKSALLQMADNHLVKDANGIPVELTNTQGMSPTTISKIKDILDDVRMQGLINQAKDLNNQKTELQVQQLEQRVQ